MRSARNRWILPLCCAAFLAGCDRGNHAWPGGVTPGEAQHGTLTLLPEPDLRPVLEAEDLLVLLDPRGVEIPDSLVGHSVRVVGTAYRGHHPGSARMVLDSIGPALP
jgi:hypothetical protein